MSISILGIYVADLVFFGKKKAFKKYLIGRTIYKYNLRTPEAFLNRCL